MISIIVAVAQNNVIGNKNQLIWHITEDLQYFKKRTSGHTVIMGRKTFESIGKPLPKRKNIIITTDTSYKAEGCFTAHSLGAAIKLAQPDDEIFIIGGGSIYREAVPFADTIYLTRVCKDYEGDTYFPELTMDEWKEIEHTDFERGEKFEYPFSFIVYKRNWLATFIK
ncbi:MAG: dihydrofolate reductase [Prevotellaceae bacterium]|jgi:dihydrofolate reductase|nr:dihydrofolate reductase [Prevotellaceae bacterium]